MSGCPADQELEQFLDGELPEAQQSSCSDHIDRCSRCQEALDRLTGGAQSSNATFAAEFGRLSSQLRQTPLMEIDHETSQTPQTSRQEPPVQIDGYDLLETIGSGGMAVVYRANARKLDRIVAIKVLRESANSDTRTRFFAEAKVVARLRHPNIVQIFEVGEASGRPYLVLEYVPGGNLDKLIDGKPQLAGWSSRLVEQVARAVAHAHRSGIVHRDLKPANVLLQPDAAGPNTTPLVADFGLALSLAGSNEARATVTGAVLGTPSYMAPEQVDGPKTEVGPSCDIYALGGVLYQCLTGRPPFVAEDPVSTLVQVVFNDPIAPRRLVPAVPRELETICLKCLEKSPSRRYATADDLADDLQRFLDGKPITARPASNRDHVAKWARRHPAIASLLVTIAMLIITSLGVFAVLWQRAADRAIVARQAQSAAEASEADALRLRAESEERRKRAEILSAELAFSRGMAQCERGQHQVGLLWLVRSLELAESAKSPLLEHAVRVAIAEWSTEVVEPKVHQHFGDPITSVAFRPDGQVVAIALRNQVRFLSPLTGKDAIAPLQVFPAWRLKKNTIRRVAWSTDGARIGVACDDGIARIWSLDERQKPIELKTADSEDCWQIEFTPDGTEVLTLTDNAVLSRWSVVTGARVGATLRISNDRGYYTFAVSPTGSTVATGGIDHAVRVWGVSNWAPVGEPTSKGTLISSLAYSDRNQLVFGSQYGTSQRVTIVPKETELISTNAHPVEFVAASIRGDLVAVGETGGKISFFDRRTLVPVGAPILSGSAGMFAAFSPDGTSLAMVDATGRFRVYSTPPRRTTGPIFDHPLGETTIGLSFHPNQRLTTVTLQGAVNWSTDTGTRSASETLIEDTKLTSSAVSPDGRWLATGAYFGKFAVYDVEAWKLVAKDQSRMTTPVTAIAWFDDNRRLVTVSPIRAGAILLLQGCWLWDLPIQERTPKRILADVKIDPTCVATIPGSSHIVVGFRDGRVRFWDVQTDRQLGDPIVHPGQITSIAVSGDGQRVLTGCSDGSARLWDRKGQLIVPPMRHDDEVTCVAIGPDDSLMTGGADRLVRVWDARSGYPLGAPMRHSMPVSALAVRPDGKAIATGTRAPHTQIWPLPGSPIEGTSSEVRNRIEVLLGATLDSNGTIRPN